MGVTLQRVHLDSCYGNKTIATFYPVGDGQVTKRQKIFLYNPALIEDPTFNKRYIFSNFFFIIYSYTLVVRITKIRLMGIRYDQGREG